MGKYSSLRGKIPDFVPEANYQTKVNERKQELLGDVPNPEHANVAYLAYLYSSQRDKKSELEDQVKDINMTLAALEQVIGEKMQTDQQQSLTLTGGASLYLQDDIYPATEDRNAVIQWVKDTNQEQLLSITPQTLKGLVRTLLEEGKDVMPGVKVFLKTGLRFRGARNGG